MDPNIKMETADFRFEPSKHFGVYSSSNQLIMPAVVPQIAVNPWEDISRARVEVVTDDVQQEMYPHAHPSFLPRPSARSASRPSSCTCSNNDGASLVFISDYHTSVQILLISRHVTRLSGGVSRLSCQPCDNNTDK